MARTSNQLRQCLSQVSAAGSPTYRPAVDAFRVQVDKAIAEGDVESDDLFARLSRAWRIMLRGSVPHSSRRYFDDFLSGLTCSICKQANARRPFRWSDEQGVLRRSTPSRWSGAVATRVPPNRGPRLAPGHP